MSHKIKQVLSLLKTGSYIIVLQIYIIPSVQVFTVLCRIFALLHLILPTSVKYSWVRTCNVILLSFTIERKIKTHLLMSRDVYLQATYDKHCVHHHQRRITWTEKIENVYLLKMSSEPTKTTAISNQIYVLFVFWPWDVICVCFFLIFGWNFWNFYHAHRLFESHWMKIKVVDGPEFRDWAHSCVAPFEGKMPAWSITNAAVF